MWLASYTVSRIEDDRRIAVTLHEIIQSPLLPVEASNVGGIIALYATTESPISRIESTIDVRLCHAIDRDLNSVTSRLVGALSDEEQ